jgi:PAS domain S-box-containing protein
MTRTPEQDPDAPGMADGPDGAAQRLPADVHRLLIENVRDYAIFVLDARGHIVTWNEGARRLKGYAPDEIIGRHFSVFYPPEDLAWDKPGMELRVARSAGRFEDEGWRVRNDGSHFWANVIITALFDESGTHFGFAKITRDLTERRNAELKAIEDARRLAEAEAANRAKTGFLAAMSHELRTPLNAIGGYADLLLAGVHGPVSSEQAAALERIQLNHRHLLALINDVLNFSRIEAGRLSYDSQAVPLAGVLEEVRSMIAPQALTKGIEVRWPPPDPSLVAQADRLKTEQILLNLLTNALKFTPAGGHVSVTQHRSGGLVALAVEDDGPGIPADQQEQIFEPFTQLGRSWISAHEGAGLGLSISRELARAMGGDLIVSSETGRGSVFTLTLPAHQA